MKVFLTGASGRLGTHIIPHLLSRGHTVSGLVRSESSANKIKAFGPSVTPVLGSLEDRDLLTASAKSHDAVLHCAMDHKADPAATHQTEREIIHLFADALEGTNKVLIMSSGTAFLPPGSDETSRASPTFGVRAGTETVVLDLKFRGIRSVSLRLAMNTHSPESMHGFFGFLIDASDKFGFIPYTENTHWSACNADDAGLLYVLTMESAEAGTAAHAVQEFVPVKDIAQVLGKKTGKKVGKIEGDQLQGLGWLSMLLQLDQNVKTDLTKKTFGWEPKGQRLLDELEAADGPYFSGRF